MRYDKFELSVAVPSNRGLTKIPEYGYKNLTFIEGRRDQHYSLKLRNDAAGRVLAVVSIDGRNVLDGEPCTPQARGYVIPAYSTVDINGWRTSLNEVHNFYFTDRSASYSQGISGEIQNCGIIAVKFFSEKLAPAPTWIIPEQHHHHHHHDHYEPSWPPYWPKYPKWPYPDVIYSQTNATPPQYGAALSNDGSQGPVGMNSIFTCQTTNVEGSLNACSATPSEIPEFKLGTGWGGAREDQVGETTFERQNELCTLSIYYAEASDLQKVGIQLAKDLAVTPPAPVLPQAFAGFCKPPINR